MNLVTIQRYATEMHDGHIEYKMITIPMEAIIAISGVDDATFKCERVQGVYTSYDYFFIEMYNGEKIYVKRPANLKMLNELIEIHENLLDKWETI